MSKRSSVAILLIPILLGFTLNGCAFMKGRDNERQAAVCSQLKNKILMNGATSDQREALVQRSELANLNKTYRDEGCDQ